MISERLKGLFTHKDTPAGWPEREELQSALPALNTAALAFARSLRSELNDPSGWHAETAIAGAAAMAGSLIFRGSVPVPAGAAPGTVVLGHQGHEGQDRLLHFMSAIAQGMKVSKEGWADTIPPEHQPEMEAVELLTKLQGPFEKVAAESGLEPRFYPFIAALTAMSLVRAGRETGQLDENVGKALAALYATTGARSVPPPLKRGSKLAAYTLVSKTPAKAKPLSQLSGRYDFWSGHLDWLNPTPADLDDEIRSLCQRFIGATERGRADLAASLSSEDSYALQHFAGRMAILGLRSKDVDLLREGLTAANAVNAPVMDFRDLGHPFDRLYYCLRRSGFDADREFEAAAERFGGRMSEVMRARAHLLSPLAIDEFREKDGIIEVESADGAGFIDTWYETYHPAVDLIGPTVGLVGTLRNETHYQFEGVRMACFLPWPLRVPSESRVGDPPPGVLGACEASARLRPEYDPGPNHGSVFAQELSLYLAQAETAERAGELAEVANGIVQERAVLLGVSRGSLLGIAFAVSSQQDSPPVETATALGRFRRPLTDALERLQPSIPGGTDQGS